MPTKDVKDAALSGSLKYTVRLNGEVAATGTAAAGAAVNTNFTTTVSGMTNVTVTAEIAASGNTPAAVSAPVSQSVRLGYDQPKKPTGLKAAANGQNVTLTWKAPTGGVNGGFFDADKLTYTVVRMNITSEPRRHSLTGTYRAKEDGLHYFGIHCISDADQSTLFVDNMKITEVPSTAPEVPSDFKVVAGEKGASYTNISVKAPTTTITGAALSGNLQLPEGTKYFAIRCVSNNKFALLLDDIKFVEAGSNPEDLQLNGYNVYRDGKKVNKSLVSGEKFTDNTLTESAKYGYVVTAVYDKGESLASNLAEVEVTVGINDIDAAGVNVSVEKNTLVVTGAMGKTVTV